MANEQNLVPINERTKSEQREITRKGGIASGIARRQKKTLAQIGDMIGGLDIKSEETKQRLREAGIADEDMVNDVAMLFELNRNAKKGDVKSIELLAKLRGQLNDKDLFGSLQVESVTINFGKKKVIDGEVS